MTATTLPVLTSDERWARANGATERRADGRWLVPADLERFTFAGREWVRATFPTAPRDAQGQRVLACPVAFLP